MSSKKTIAEIGELIRKARRAKDLTQENVADMAGCSVPIVQRIEKGEDNTTMHSIISICEALGIDTINIVD